MKNSIIIFALLCITFFSSSAQDMVNPIDLLEGNWLLKINTISPTPADNEWKTTHSIVSYDPIMKRSGLKQTAYSEFMETEMYYFFDAAKRTLYGMCADENGYMWQTEMACNKKGNFDMTTGGPMHDTSLNMTNNFQIISDSELSFDHVEYKNGKEIMKVTGKLYKIPVLPANLTE